MLAHNTPGTWPIFEVWLAFLFHVQEATGSNFVVQDQSSRLKYSIILSLAPGKCLREVP